MKCRKCGKELRPNDTFCYNCGEKTGILQRFFSKKAFVGDILLGILIIVVGIITWKIVTGEISLTQNSSNQATISSTSIVEKQNKETAKDNTNKNEKNKENINQVSNSKDNKIQSDSQQTKEKESNKNYPINVTKSMAKDFVSITKSMKPFLSYSAPYYNDGSHKFKWDNTSATSCVLYNMYFGSKAIKYGTPYENIEKLAKKEMKNLFGNYKKYNFVYGEYYPDYVFIKTNNTIIFNASHIRNGKKYDLKVNKIIQKNKDTFILNIKAGLKASTESESSYEDYILTLKSDKKSKYKYVIKKLALK